MAADTVSFKEDVTIIGMRDEAEVTAKSDTGAKRTSIDMEIAGAVGAGPITGTRTFRSSTGKSVRPLVEIEVRVLDETRAVTASVADRSSMSTAVLLGRDVLSGMKVQLE